MKPLVKTQKSAKSDKKKPGKTSKRDVAQCCAKISRTVAGCHD